LRSVPTKLLKIEPSLLSIDYVNNKKQFQLHTLVTEQRHPRTWNLSFAIKEDIEQGLRQILAVDEDIATTFQEITENRASLYQAARAVAQAIKERKKIFIYGCGSTGRLAKQMESAIWRPFWKRIKEGRFWNKLNEVLPEDMEDRLTGEMTGGDRALISALEGFEDLQLMGKLQVQDQGVEKGDVIFCITEGGETSSVIGALLTALEQYGELTRKSVEEAKNHLYFIYNNPDEVLQPFERSRSVIENPALTRINLTTGPQAITGSTRMQAATSETFLMGAILEKGIHSILKGFLTDEELAELGFSKEPRIEDRLRSFNSLRKILTESLNALGRFTWLESETYKKKRFSTYFAQKALITVFIDCAERSPTFHLFPLDTVLDEKRKCWLQVWTNGKDHREAWKNFLGRNFRGLEETFYRPHFLTQIDDRFLKNTALKSLTLAGNDQERFFDFSFAEENIKKRGPQEGDLGVLVAMDDEIDELADPDSSWRKFVNLFKHKKANLALILISDRGPDDAKGILSRLPLKYDRDIVLQFRLDRKDDPLELKRQTLLKILLNAHSTAVMARIGRVVGNTMTDVNPSNLKLIGRATYLIMSHVNDTVSRKEWVRKHGKTELISYAEANAVLFAAIEYTAEVSGQTSEVSLSIIRILEALRTKKYIPWEDALHIAETQGLESYLEIHNPALQIRGVERKRGK
jgi:N-acetylmuramic acid 6-phosphate etherase